MYIHNKLRYKIVEKYGNVKQFHTIMRDKLSCSYSTVNNKLNGICGFTQNDIITWADCLSIDPSEIYEYFFI